MVCHSHMTSTPSCIGTSVNQLTQLPVHLQHCSQQLPDKGLIGTGVDLTGNNLLSHDWRLHPKREPPVMIIVLRLTVELDSFAGENFRKFLRENPTQIHNRPRTPTHCSFALLVRALLRVDYVLPKSNVHCNWVIVSRIATVVPPASSSRIYAFACNQWVW